MLIEFLPHLVLISILRGSLSVPNFSLTGVRICTLWQLLQNVRKEERETKKKTESLVVRISEMARAIFFTFCM